MRFPRILFKSRSKKLCLLVFTIVLVQLALSLIINGYKFGIGTIKFRSSDFLGREKISVKFPHAAANSVLDRLVSKIAHLRNLSNDSRRDTELTERSSLPDTAQDSGPVRSWERLAHCGGKLIQLGQSMAIIRDVIVDRRYIDGLPGGQEVDQILNIAEKKEFYKISPGAFGINCENRYLQKISLEGYLGDYARVLNVRKSTTASLVVKEPTIMITRMEYANVYWMIIDLYNAYLTLRSLAYSPEVHNVSVLIFDGHPKSTLDPLWKQAFTRVYRIGSLPQQTLFSTLIWQHQRSKTPLLNKNSPNLPQINNFKSFIYKICNIKPLPVDCKNSSVFFIWRHNYVAHARNPQGLVKRKFANEDEMLEATKQKFRSFKVVGEQLDKYSPCEQIERISQADVVVAMHGAAVTYALFMKPGASFIEIYPPSYRAANWHMTKICQWARVKHQEWMLLNRALENTAKQITTIPVNELLLKIESNIPRCR